MKKIHLLIFILIISIRAAGAPLVLNLTSDERIHPFNPGSSLVIQLNMEDGFEARECIAASNPLGAPDTLLLKQTQSGFWQTTLNTKPQDRIIFLQFPTGFGPECFELIAHGPDGKPLESAFQQRALFYTGINPIVPEDLDLALSSIETELSFYPENTSAQLLAYTIRLRLRPDDAEKRAIRDEVNQKVKKSPNDEAVLSMATEAYQMIGETNLAQQTEAQLAKVNPDNERVALKKLNEILGMKDIQKKYEVLNEFAQAHANSQIDEYALSQMATAAIALTDSAKMRDVGDRLLEKSVTPAGASALAGLAGVLSENDVEINRAVAYAKKAIDILRSLEPSFKPPEISKEEWTAQITLTIGKYDDILGWALFRQGHVAEAIPLLRDATETYFQAGPFLHLAEALDVRGSKDEALVQYARAAAFGGDIGQLAEETLTDRWEQVKPGENLSLFKQKQTQWVEEAHRQKILSAREIRPAPDFELTSMSGGRVRLSDQRGTPVLLCFWSTWSASSKLVLKELHALAQDLGDEVLFLTVAVDPNKNDVIQYMRKYQFGLPALFNDGTDESFQIQGVPVIFLIDAEGRIHFEHKGYRPDLDEVLRIELNDIR